MRSNDLPEFTRLLSDFLMGYGKPRPDAETIAFWFKSLSPFSPATIGQAFNAYSTERPDFAPAPTGIVARCKLMDGRPEENEAWAVALTSRDERETVMWTEEMAEAFNLCRPVLESGDEIGARMAFKDAYSRLVLTARAQNRPAKWSVSAGWDGERRELVVSRAVAAGLLSGPQPHLALGYDGDLPPARPEGLERVMGELSKLESPLDKLERVREQHIVAETESERQRREEIDRQAREYLKQHPEARYGQLKPVSDGQDEDHASA